MTRSRRLAYLALLGNALVWGLALPIAKRGFAEGLTPTTFLLARFAIAALASLPIIIFFCPKNSLKKALKIPTLLKIISLELLGTVLALSLLYEGLAHTSAIEASLIAITWPIFVTIGAVIFLKEVEEARELTGLILAIIGTLVLVLKPGQLNPNPDHALGNLLIIGQNLSIAAYYLLAKRIYRPLNKWAVTHVSFWVGIIGFSAITLAKGISPISALTSLVTNPSPWPLASAIYMALAGSIIGLTLYLIGQDRIEASEAALFTYLQPLVSIPTAILLLHENITGIEIVGAAIITLGIVLAERRPRKTRQKLVK